MEPVVTIGLTADRGRPVLSWCWEFGELSGCRMAQQSMGRRGAIKGGCAGGHRPET